MTCPACGNSGWYMKGRIREECPCRAWARKVAAMAKADQERLYMVIRELMRRAQS